MNISNYQMHNVLKVYTRQLSRNRTSEYRGVKTAKPASDSISISAEAKRQVVIDKVTADIVDRITRKGPQSDVDREIVDRLRDEIDRQAVFDQSNRSDFVYNVIDADRKKEKTRLSVEDSDFLVKRLEHLAKEAADKMMAS
jgi:hypothetical protein